MKKILIHRIKEFSNQDFEYCTDISPPPQELKNIKTVKMQLHDFAICKCAQGKYILKIRYDPLCAWLYDVCS